MNMLRSRSSWSGIVFVVLLAPVWGTVAWSDEDPSGAPAGYRVAPVAVPQAPAGLNDMLQPLAPLAVAAPARAVPTDLDNAAPPSWSSVALWERLTAFTPAQRVNAAIELELGGSAGPADRLAAARIQELWGEGRYDEAIAELRSYENAGGRAALGIAWKEPVAREEAFATAGALATSGGGTDVRIGTRTGGHITTLEEDAASGALYAVVAWGATSGGEAWWTVNRSTDNGATWTETYVWTGGASSGIVDMSATVVGGYVYIGYVSGDAANEYRLRRCLASTGGVDNAYSYHTVVDVGTLTIREVTVVSNAMSSNNRVYCFAIQSDNAVRHFWTVASTATSFTESSPVGASASQGLDATWNPGYASCYLQMCYSGTDGKMHVQRYSGTWSDVTLLTSNVLHRHGASVSSYHDVVICAYEYQMTNGQGIAYGISYDGGASGWDLYNYVFEPASGEGPYQCPDVDTHNGVGCAIIASHEEGEPDAVYCRKRAVFAPGVWEDKWKFNDNDVQTGTQTTLAHVPMLDAPCFSLGAIYFYGTTPYFDLPMLGTTAVPDAGVAANVRLDPPAPNPLADRATVRLALPTAARARLEVFDVLGRRVATLADGTLEAGAHSFTLDGRRLASGVHFCRLSAGPVQRVSRFVVIH
jgi:hypothetical protein